MKLPHLDQLVPLERGEAGLLARSLAVLMSDATLRPPMSRWEALQLTPLASLGRRLLGRHEQEQRRPLRPSAGRRPPAPRPFRVRYDELVVVHENRTALLYTNLSESEQLQLQVLLGKFHQKSLNLDHCIKFS